MKLYRTRTQEEYDWLMEKLEDEGCFWEMSRLNPTARNNFDEYGDRTIIRVNIADDTLAYGIDRLFPNELITEVSDLMKEKQMKFQVGDEVRVVDAPLGTFRRNYVGEIHKVTMVDNSKIPYELSNRFWCREEDIELVVDHDVLMQKVLERNNKPDIDTNKVLETDKYTRHKEITDFMHNTYVSKNKDYGNSFERTHREIGSRASLGRIADKFYRLQNIILNDEQHVEDETVKDTLIDMANYAIMFAMELEEEE